MKKTMKFHKKNKIGEIATIITIGSLVFILVATIASTLLSKKPQTTTTKATGTCASPNVCAQVCPYGYAYPGAVLTGCGGSTPFCCKPAPTSTPTPGVSVTTCGTLGGTCVPDNATCDVEHGVRNCNIGFKCGFRCCAGLGETCGITNSNLSCCSPNVCTYYSNDGGYNACKTPTTPTPTRTPTPIKTNTPTPIKTNTPTPIKTNTPTPIKTNTPTPIKTNTPTPIKTNTPTPIKTNTPTPIKTNTPTPTTPPGEPTNTPIPTRTPTPILPTATPPSSSCPTIVSASPSSVTIGQPTDFQIIYTKPPGVGLYNTWFGMTKDCSTDTGEAYCGNFERMMSKSLGGSYSPEARWGSVGNSNIPPVDSCQGYDTGGLCAAKYFPYNSDNPTGSSDLPIDNSAGTATVNSASASAYTADNRITVTWNVTLHPDFPPGTYNYYAMVTDANRNFQSCTSSAYWTKLTTTVVSSGPIATPTPTHVPPTATPIPGCLCENDTCADVCAFDKFDLPVTYTDPMKCSQDSTILFSTPTADQKNGWCRANLRTKGDVDGNGVFDRFDYFYYVSAVNGGQIPASANADADGDGTVSTFDRAIITRSQTTN
mgnify:CR=1 FL=1